MNFGHGYKPSKYGSKKIVYNGEVFHSKKELNRYRELLLIQRAGMIHGLERQVKFDLTPPVREPDKTGPRGGKKPGKDGVGTKYINISNIVSLTELEVEE